MASGTWGCSVSDAWRCVLAATLAAVGEAALCAAAQMSGSLADEDATHSVGEAAERWDVEFLGRRDPPLHANESSWRFRATERATGETRTFASGTEDGFFVLARTYESLALIGADAGSGSWGFTVYDIEGDVKIAEFRAASPHLSPDNRYLAYRAWLGGWERIEPEIRLLDLARAANGLEPAGASSDPDEVGDVVFPDPPPAGRPELAGAYGRTATSSWFWFEHAAWDMGNGVLYFVAPDRAGCLNLVALGLAAGRIACRVPLTVGRLRSEYFEEQRLVPTGLVLQSPGTVVVSVRDGADVRSSYEIRLRPACWEQNLAFAESLEL